MKVATVPVYYRILDYLLAPIMWMLSGFVSDKPQESHVWHMQNFNCSLVSDTKGILILGDDTLKFTHSTFILTHTPILGGWKKYVIFETGDFKKFWHIGWKVYYNNRKKQPLCQIQKLNIYAKRAKLLVGKNDSKKIFFGVNETGEIIPLKIVGKGTLGDKKFPDVRLF